ncbi:hypothetical protein SUGI_0371790 [Cryptomeria japonica]|nr:hypothetical protein SUGI_0371790 [Cryptomeria japonica]
MADRRVRSKDDQNCVGTRRWHSLSVEEEPFSGDVQRSLEWIYALYNQQMGVAPDCIYLHLPYNEIGWSENCNPMKDFFGIGIWRPVHMQDPLFCTNSCSNQS